MIAYNTIDSNLNMHHQLIHMIITGTRVVSRATCIMLLHYTNVLLVHNERFPNFAAQLAMLLLF